MINRYLIIDDFYSNPDEIAAAALESPKEEASPAGHERGQLTTKFFLEQTLRELFQKLTLEPAIVSSSSSNGKILFTQENEGPELRVHCDAGMHCKWTGVVFLSSAHPRVEGTCFWRHLPTGLEVAPTTAEGLAKYGWDSFEEFTAAMETGSQDESLWKKTFTIPYKFNRLVLFRPWQFHSHGSGFGNSLESAKKVQTLSFASQQPQQQW